ncbi:UNVERIFIED_CONTAM: hypothetical protein FKN15_041115 [Acipenser sinensis]
MPLFQGPTNVLVPQYKSVLLKNVSSLPLNMQMTLEEPFSICDKQGDLSLSTSKSLMLSVGKEVELWVQFEPSYRKDCYSWVAEECLVFQYLEHPQKDYISLHGEVHFPNLHFSSMEVDFGCILNDTEVLRTVDMSNCSPLPVKYRWSFLVDDWENKISSPPWGSDHTISGHESAAGGAGLLTSPLFFMAGSSPSWGSGHNVATPGEAEPPATPGEAGSPTTPGDGSSSGPSGGDGSSCGPSGGDGSSSGPSGGDGSSSGPSGGELGRGAPGHVGGSGSSTSPSYPVTGGSPGDAEQQAAPGDAEQQAAPGDPGVASLSGAGVASLGGARLASLGGARLAFLGGARLASLGGARLATLGDGGPASPNDGKLASPGDARQGGSGPSGGDGGSGPLGGDCKRGARTSGGAGVGPLLRRCSAQQPMQGWLWTASLLFGSILS